MRTSETFSTVAKALIAAKADFALAKKSGHNKHLGNNYANLDDVLEAITPSMKENKLMVIQSTLDRSTEKLMYIETMILHESGEFMAFEYQMPIEGTKAQQYGSTTSYGRRYALCAVLGISQADDDAEIAKRTASDYKKLVEACEDLEMLGKIHADARSKLSAAEWKIAEGHLQKRKAELTAGARRGFPGNAHKPEAQPEQKPEKQEPSQPEKKVVNSGSEIENFG